MREVGEGQRSEEAAEEEVYGGGRVEGQCGRLREGVRARKRRHVRARETTNASIWSLFERSFFSIGLFWLT